MNIHHIGILVDNYEATKNLYVADFWYQVIKESVNSDKFCFLSKDGALPYIELLSLQKNILNLPAMHIAYQVENIQIEYDKFLQKWYESILAPWNASMIKQKAFLRIKNEDTVIELVEI